MVILLEGADGAGKSTLYEKLKESLSRRGFNFIKHLDRDALGHHLWWKKKIDSPYVYVIDRGFLSEVIYRPIKRDKKPNISLDEFSDLCTENLCIIYCKTTSQLDDMVNRGDDYVSVYEYPDIVKAYDVITGVLETFTKVKIYQYDWFNDNYVELIENIRSFANK